MTWPSETGFVLANEDFGVKISQKYDHSMICHTAKTLLQDYKRLFLYISLQSLLCKFKLYKSRLNHSGSLKIDKRHKSLKVNILSDAEWLFGVTPKGTCCKNNVILHKKSD